MKVKELIEKLKEFDQELDVAHEDMHTGYEYAIEEAEVSHSTYTRFDKHGGEHFISDKPHISIW